MTNGEKIQKDFKGCEVCEPIVEDDVIHVIFADKKESAIGFDWSWWNSEYKEQTNTIDYCRAFKIACDLLNGDILYGVDTDRIYELMMQKDGVVSSSSYEEYILNNLQELDQGQYVSSSEKPNKSEIPTSSTTKNCESCEYYGSHHEVCNYCYKCSLWTEKEPTIKNDLAQERYQDLIEYFGGEDIVLKDRKEFKAWLERVKWHVKRADELARELEQIKGTTKENLAVDAVSRREVINQIFYSTDNSGDVVLGSALMKRIEKLPSVTPQLSSELEKNSKKLEKDFGESDCISRQAVLDLIADYDLSMGEVVRGIHALSPVTPIRPKGRWIEERNDYGEITHWHCSNCYDDSGFTTTCKWDYCPNCGSDNREVEE